MSCHSANLITWAKVHICSELQYYLAEFRIAPGPIFPLPMSPDLVLLMASIGRTLLLVSKQRGADLVPLTASNVPVVVLILHR